MAAFEPVTPRGIYQDQEKGFEPVTPEGIVQEQSAPAAPSGFQAAWAISRSGLIGAGAY